MDDTYDLVVIGGGAGGVPAAIRAAQLGASVALVEENFLGGMCMNRGCIPFGHMMTAARILGSLTLGKEMGIKCRGLSVDFPLLMKRQNELIPFMRQGVESLLSKNKITLIRARGKLAGMGRVEANGKTLSAGKIILATGAEWVNSPLPGGDLPEVVNSDHLLTIAKLPKRCLLFGDAPMAIEIAQFLGRYGSRVWLATREHSLLSWESKAIRTRLSKALAARGITILDRTEVFSMEKKGGVLRVTLRVRDKEETIPVDLVVTLRRKASLRGLGLDSIGMDEQAEYIPVNEYMETEVQGLYAVGDATASEERQFSHLASSGGMIAAENALGLRRTMNLRSAARILFTEPQVACVGLTLKDAKVEGYDAVSGSAPLSMNPLGMILAQNEGLVEVVAEKRYGELLGVHIIGQGASEMAGSAVLAIQMEATLEDLANASFPHPTLSESIAEAARDALARPIYLP